MIASTTKPPIVDPMVCGMMQVWMHVLGSRCRRFIVVLLLISLLLAAQIITHLVRPVSDIEEAIRSSHLASIQQQVEGRAAGVGRPEDVNTAATRQLDMRLKQQETMKKEIIDNLSHMETKELQKVMRLLDSTRDPKAVQQFRIDHALQALKVNLLEEVSSRKFPDIMEAAHNARALSQQARPRPLQIVIATTWRSGSTFLEELLSAHPAVYTYYEPLTQYGLHQIRDGDDSVQAQKLIHNLLTCRFHGNDEYMVTVQRIKEMVSRNTLIWKICSSKDWGNALCFNDVFLKGACELFPWITMKIVRLRLKFLRPILEDKSLNARIVYLVRDPRGVINSRTDTVQWCKTKDCYDPQYLCSDMKDDLPAALKLQEDFPGRLYILRYEDMSLNPVNKTRELLDYLGFDFDPKMEEFLASHTTTNIDKPWSTSRESKKRVTYWASKLSSDKLQAVQTACDGVMKRFGYLPVTSTKNISLDKILGPLELTNP
ncbi:carbohydrate sulfotransferase 4-like isoform X3 [Panulirus ornatus]|uniref:carbohydrate sulfotransferase 4-like isoform X3 n=1 Tax=Panulirus ornatus TaxID=150431 RepID=UPI003A843DAD